MAVINLRFESRKPTLKFDPSRTRARRDVTPRKPAVRRLSRREQIEARFRVATEGMDLNDTDRTLIEAALKIVSDVLDRNLPHDGEEKRFA